MGSFVVETILLIFLIVLVQKSESVGFAPELYCGLENCYDVLEINREEFDKQKLSKAYRALARKHHPDRVKSKEEKGLAEERFRVIATAYETLKDEEAKTNYDYYLDHPDQRFYNYYQYYRLRVAPKVDVRLVIVGTILVISLFQYLSAKHKFAEAIEYATGVGKFRNMAIKDGIDKGLLEMDRNGKLKKTKGVDNDAIIKQIIIDNLDVTGGYKKESLYETLAWHTIVFPVTICRYIKWNIQWYWRFSVQKEELDDEAKLYLIRRYLGVSQLEFDQRYEADIDNLFERECWIKENCLVWKAEKDAAEQEKMAQSGRYKRYKRYMKNAGTISFVDEE
ncbi:hypothetical protein CAEBREN_24808 [Caenorhabditis brenneri]|uniref:J domain-containing protein n=2 Tax=Caenorhabditis brenneri TaxID=135651 RepID=G0P6R2_CAEBE|nr:hypothetical protein CAEBREN_24808 [Caenorhabditis brenneri]